MPERPSAGAAEQLARWLLTAEGSADTTPAQLALAGSQAYQRLRAHLAIYLGSQGFDALWDRALQLVQRDHPWDASTDRSADLRSAHQLEIALLGRDTGEAQAVLLAIFTQFLALLFTFIGVELGLRLLRQCWPTLPAPTIHT